MLGILCVLSFIFAVIDISEKWYMWLIGSIIFGILHIWREKNE